MNRNMIVPHPGYTARSNYDANHKISSDSIAQSFNNNATYNEAASYMLHENEADRVNGLSEVGEVVTIENTTDHAENVEYGFSSDGAENGSRSSGPKHRGKRPWKHIEPYYTYTKAKSAVVATHGNVLK